MDQLLIFSIDNRRHAVPLLNVEQVLRAVEVMSVPGAPSNILGTINLSGVLIPVLNLRKHFGYTEKEIEPSDHFIIARGTSVLVALVTDYVENVLQVERVTDSHGVLPNLNSVKGFAISEGETVLIHTIDSLFPPEGSQ